MNKKDISILIDDIKLNIRVGAIINYKNKILIEKNKNVDFAVIPGGRIKTLENSKEALIREVKEEIGIDITNEKIELIGLIENFFNFNNNTYHELYLIYKVELNDTYNIEENFINKDDSNASYNLISKNEINNIKMMPYVLKEIVNLDSFKHYIVNNSNN